MTETNPPINPTTGREWDLNSLIQKLLDLQDSLAQAQERNIILSAQARELERQSRDAADLKSELANQVQLMADKSRENKHLHQELSRIAAGVETKIQEIAELNTAINDLQHQLKTCQSERDLLAVMLTDAEHAAVATKSGQRKNETANKGMTADESQSGNWMKKYLKGKD